MRRLVMASAVLAVAACITPAIGAGGAITVRLQLAQTGACSATGNGSDVTRLLTQATTTSTACPQVDATGSLRKDETYPLQGASSLPGVLSATRLVSLSAAFGSTVQGQSVPGYVDANVTVSINGLTAFTKHVAGVIQPGANLAASASGRVPGAAAGSVVRSVAVSIAWNAGTTPWVEPAFGGTSYLTVPLDLPDGVITFAGTTTARSATASKCPPDAPAHSGCYTEKYSGELRGLGNVTVSRWSQLSVSGDHCVSGPTHGTLTVAGKDSFNFTGSGQLCLGVDTADWSYSVTIKGGTGRFARARGRATIKGSANANTRQTQDTWSGIVSTR